MSSFKGKNENGSETSLLAAVALTSREMIASFSFAENVRRQLLSLIWSCCVPGAYRG